MGSLRLIVEAVRHIDPPLLIWAGVIIACGLFFALRTWIEARRGIRAGKRILEHLRSTAKADVKDRNEGLSLERVQTLRMAIKQNGGVELPWWKTLEAALLLYRKPDGEERWYISSSARELFPPEELFEYSEVSHQSVPGILTAMGLLGTFFALFLGLIQVHDTGSSVTGLPELIDALGGKFFTSIVALAGSVGFVILERYIYAGKFDKLYTEICTRIDEVFPRISTERILLDIRQSSDHTARSTSSISSDFAGKIAGALQAQVVPALAGEFVGQLSAHLVPAIQKMESTLERLESQKQDSVVGEFSSLIEGLKTSITSALSDMGRKFHEQLSGSTKSEFTSVQETLANTAEMLRLMSGQFESTRSALADIVAAADTSSRDQARASQEQAAALHQLMNGLIDTLGRNASDNQQKITGALTNVISDLSRKVEEISEMMVHSVANAAKGSQDAAQALIAKNGEWSEATAQKLTKLLEGIEARSEEFQQAGAKLLEAKLFVADLLSKNAEALDAMGSAAGQVQSYTTALTATSSSIKDAQRLQADTVGAMRNVVDQLRQTSEGNQKILEQYSRVLEDAKTTFNGLDAEMERALNAVNEGMGKYFQTVEKNFEVIVKNANGLLPEVSTALRSQTEVLGQQLDALTDVIERVVQRNTAGVSNAVA